MSDKRGHDGSEDGSSEERVDYYQKYLEESQTNPLSRFNETHGRHIIKPDERPVEESPHGRLKHVLNEELSEKRGTPDRFTDLHIQEIPPGERSGKHSHMGEELIFVLEGEGHDLHWDATCVIRDTVTWEYADEPIQCEWESEDVIYVPTNTAHQHVNTGDDVARLLCCQTRVNNHLGLGYKDLEQFETASTYEE